MSGYESIMLLCAIVTAIVAVASFVFAICRALAKKDYKDEQKEKAYAYCYPAQALKQVTEVQPHCCGALLS